MNELEEKKEQFSDDTVLVFCDLAKHEHDRRAREEEQAEDAELSGLTSDALRERAAKLAVTRVRWAG